MRRGGTAAEAAVRSLQSAHPVLRVRLCAASTSSPTLAFPFPAPQLALASQPSALDFDSLLERELNNNPWASLFVRIHTASCDHAASGALLKEFLAHLSGAGDPEEDEEAAVEAGRASRQPAIDQGRAERAGEGDDVRDGGEGDGVPGRAFQPGAP